MTFRGHIKNGQVVVESGISLPEGAELDIRLAGRQRKGKARRGSTKPSDTKARRQRGKGRSLYDRLKPFIGIADGLPRDSSVNLDHYLYGHPKRS